MFSDSLDFILFFTMLERIGKMAYHLNLAASKQQALQGLHDVFHVNLLRRYQSNGLDYEAPPIKIDKLTPETKCRV